MVTLTCLGDTSGGVGNKRASTSSWWSCRALALGMFSWKMEPSWNCVNGQKTEKLQRMVFYDQACLIFVKNRVVKVSTSHHPRYAVCISPLPCFGRSASLALLHLLRLTSALLHPSNEEQESWCIPPHVCTEALGSGHPVLPWDVWKIYFSYPPWVSAICSDTASQKWSVDLFAKYGNCVQNVMGLQVNVFSNSRSNKCSCELKSHSFCFCFSKREMK